jgi:TP901 family phage tail tape measure protein/lambda family phage tail tape measure protein
MPSQELLFIMKMRDELSDAITRMGGNVEKAGDKAKHAEHSFTEFAEKVGRQMTVAFAALAEGVGVFLESTHAFVEFEDKLNAVQRATNLDQKAVEELGGAIQHLAETSPQTRDTLLDMAAAAGEIGVRGEKGVQEFVEAMNKLASVSNVTGAAGATAFAEFLRTGKLGTDQANALASVLVRLNNDFGASEKQTLEMGNTLEALVGRFGVTGASALALGAAISTMGIRSEQAIRSLPNTFASIEQAIAKGGLAARAVSELTGIAQADLRRAFGEDALGVFQRFLSGISQLSQEGKVGDAEEAFKLLGIQGAELNSVLVPMAQNQDRIRAALAASNDEMRRQTAIQAEYKIATEQLGTELQNLGETFKGLFTDIGAALAPVLSAVVEALQGIVTSVKDAFEALPPDIRTVVAVLITIVPAIVGVAAAFAALVTVLGFIGVSLAALTPALFVIAGVMGAVALAVHVAYGYFEELRKGVEAALGRNVSAAELMAAAWAEFKERAATAITDFLAVVASIPSGVAIALRATLQFMVEFARRSADIFVNLGSLLAGAIELNPTQVVRSYAALGPLLSDSLKGAFTTATETAKTEYMALLKTLGYVGPQITSFTEDVAKRIDQALTLGGEARRSPEGGGLVARAAAAILGTNDPNLAGITGDAQRKLDEMAKQVREHVDQLKAQLFEQTELMKIQGQTGLQYATNTALIRAEAQAMSEHRTITQQEIAAVKDLAGAQYELQASQRTEQLQNQIRTNQELLAVNDQVGRQREESIAVIQAQSAALEQHQVLTESQIDQVKRLADSQYDLQHASQSAASGARQFFETYAEEANNLGQVTQTVLRDITSGLETLLTNFFTGQEVNVGQFVQTIISEILRLYVIKPLLADIFGGLGDGSGGLFGAGGLFSQLTSAHGNAFSHGQVQAFERGGVTRGPVFFGFRNAAGGRGVGVAGEAGDEAIMPLARNSRGDLGVRVSGGGGGVVHLESSYTFNLGQGDVQADPGTASRLGKTIDEQVKATVTRVLINEQRPGGLLNRQGR